MTAETPPFDLVVRRARLAGRDRLHDIAIAGERIAAIAPAVEGDAANEIDAEGRLASPAFVQPHIHLDKVLVGPLLPANRSGTLPEAIVLLHATKRAATVEEIRERAGIVIREAVMAGTTRIRSHVDVDTIGGLTPLVGVRWRARRARTSPRFSWSRSRRRGSAGPRHRRADGRRDAVGGGRRGRDAALGARRRRPPRHVGFCFDLASDSTPMSICTSTRPTTGVRTFAIVVEEAERNRGWGGRRPLGTSARWRRGGRLRSGRDPVRAPWASTSSPTR